MKPTGESRTDRLVSLLSFSLRSLAQTYGREFMRRVVLRHPVLLLRALVDYGRVLRSPAGGERHLFRYSENDFVARAAVDGEQLVVATGFCQKPLRAAGSDHDCPSGRFNHDCLYLRGLKPYASSLDQYAMACGDCSIRVLGRAALGAHASFAVLTSALDIAHDILLPALEERRFKRVLIAICPYSVEPISLALLICGLEGFIFRYDAGSCANYGEWLRADRGDKPERTQLSTSVTDRILRLLDAIATRRRAAGAERAARYEQRHNVFRPQPQGPSHFTPLSAD